MEFPMQKKRCVFVKAFFLCGFSWPCLKAGNDANVNKWLSTAVSLVLDGGGYWMDGKIQAIMKAAVIKMVSGEDMDLTVCDTFPFIQATEALVQNSLGPVNEELHHKVKESFGEASIPSFTNLELPPRLEMSFKDRKNCQTWEFLVRNPDKDSSDILQFPRERARSILRWDEKQKAFVSETKIDLPLNPVPKSEGKRGLFGSLAEAFSPKI